jgi:hypothetical protein
MDRTVDVVPWPDSGQPDLVARLVVGRRHEDPTLAVSASAEPAAEH